ncbi:MAG: hypothetical protein HC872_06400 [Gammaproteobacteria bacterium]|nr:hypothetical protein [Gammaproteobacteria bacterium]
MGQEKEKSPDSYTYATYLNCDFTLQDRADEITRTLNKPIYDAAVVSGTITSWGWLAHHTGGEWRRVQYHTAPTLDALLASQKQLGDQVEAKDKKLNTEASKICNTHEDYIWRRAPATPVRVARRVSRCITCAIQAAKIRPMPWSSACSHRRTTRWWLRAS